MGSLHRDLFVTVNAKCSKFCSQAGLGAWSLGDAFLIKWNALLLYAFPPIPLISRVIHKIWTNRAKIILHSIDMARTDLVPLPVTHGDLHTIHTPSPTESSLSGWQSSPPSGPGETSREGMAPMRWTNLLRTSKTCVRQEDTYYLFPKMEKILLMVPDQTNICKTGTASTNPGILIIPKELRTCYELT